jgi:DNA mismatch repair protein MutS
MDDSSTTPMMRQYLQVKGEAPSGSVLFFRLGDFYEMFFEDAKRVSAILDLTLTQRQGVPMCGVPYHAIDNYLPRLLEAGVKVAIAEQLEDPKLAKGIVKRSITRVLTPGTVLDGPLLRPERNNFLCALVEEKGRFGLSWLDISTGGFLAGDFDSIDFLEDEIQTLQTKECILPHALHESWETSKAFPSTSSKALWNPQEDWIFSMEHAEETLKRQLRVATLDGFGMKGHPLAVRAAGAVLHYASENLRHPVGHVQTLKLHCASELLTLDPNCQRNLELVESMFGGKDGNTLLGVLDKTNTPMGGRLLREWILRPLASVEPIVARQDVVAALRDDPLTLAELRETIGAIRDLERIVARLNVGSGNARDILSLGHSLSMIPGVKSILSAYDLPLVESLRASLEERPELVSKIMAAIVDEPPATITEGGMIRSGFNQELDKLRSAASEGRDWVASLQAKEQERTGIKTLKIHYNKVFGFFIEISKSKLSTVPEDYIRKQTLANCERFITPELKEMESRILGADERAIALEQQLFEELRAFAATFTGSVQRSASALAELDVLCSLADCAATRGYCRPHVHDGDLLDIKAGRHPVLDFMMKGERFVPNDTLLDGAENRMMIITGPNMAGKSTYIRQTALLTIMAQLGSFIPAESASIGIADRIFTRVGAADDLSRGQSTFMVEMVETANILNKASAKSLVILDEIGRGTSTFDGLSIAWAVAEYLLDHPSCRARTQFATHYHELIEMAMTRKGVKNYNVAVREYGDQIIFLRQIIPGGADKSYGIHVAKLAGLPLQVLTRAKEILENLEDNAIAEAGEPALTVKRAYEKSGRYAGGKPSMPRSQRPGPIQPSLFD